MWTLVELGRVTSLKIGPNQSINQVKTNEIFFPKKEHPMNHLEQLVVKQTILAEDARVDEQNRRQLTPLPKVAINLSYDTKLERASLQLTIN